MTKRITIKPDDHFHELVENVRLAKENRERVNNMSLETVRSITALTNDPQGLLNQMHSSALSMELSAYTELGYWIFERWLDMQNPAGQDDENDSDPLDVCPFCGGPMKPGNQYGMCNGCRRERQSYRPDEPL